MSPVLKEAVGRRWCCSCCGVYALFLPNSAAWALGIWLDLIHLSGAGPRAESSLPVIWCLLP